MASDTQTLRKGASTVSGLVNRSRAPNDSNPWQSQLLDEQSECITVVQRFGTSTEPCHVRDRRQWSSKSAFQITS